MKTILRYLLMFWIFGLLVPQTQAQQILNGGFEETYFDSSSTYPPGHLRPLNWSIHKVLDLFWACNYVTGEMTNDSHSGEWAVQIETTTCGPLHSGGISTTMEIPNSIFFPDVSHVIDARPDQLSFYFKYNPVGGDTAGFEALLFNYPDSVTLMDPEWFSSIDTVGIATEMIIEPANNYTGYVANFEYFSSETPQYIAVFFTTNHNLGWGFEPDVAHAGTTLWIDDVELIYLSTSSQHFLQEFQVRVYPNPAAEHVQVEVPQNITLRSMQVHDFSGRHVKTLQPQNCVHSMNDLPAGLYFLTIESEKGSVVKKMVIE